MKAIETQYKGYRFRSRVEARWAVYFDADGIEWEYEKEGYTLPEVGRYLPDFWLPRVKMFAEVKAEKFSRIEGGRCYALARHSGYPVLMLDGPPDYRSYYAIEDSDGRVNVECDYIVSTGGEGYYESESRFFCSTGAAAWPTPGREDWITAAIHSHAIDASRSARFEYGESGPPAPEPKRRAIRWRSYEETELAERIQAIDLKISASPPPAEMSALILEKMAAAAKLAKLDTGRWVTSK